MKPPVCKISLVKSQQYYRRLMTLYKFPINKAISINAVDALSTVSVDLNGQEALMLSC